MSSDALVSVSEFVALLNQTLEFAYPSVIVEGELANFRVSKNRWVYFDLKDELATVRFFGTVYQLPGPLEDGMLLKVRGAPRLHPQYGFSVNVLSIQPAGEGTIRRAAELLQAKLAAEGLFDEERKRLLPYPPERIGLITSKESAAYADFVKILRARWPATEIVLKDVQVQGEPAVQQIVEAVQLFNEQAGPPDVLVLVRGGGSPEDLAAFSTEQVVRAVAGSRVPTLVAIGHEIDISLTELAADQRASTPSNAAELLVPDRGHVLLTLADNRRQLARALDVSLKDARAQLTQTATLANQALGNLLAGQKQALKNVAALLQALNPAAILERGFAIVRKGGRVVRTASTLAGNDIVSIQFADGSVEASVGKTGEA